MKNYILKLFVLFFGFVTFCSLTDGEIKDPTTGETFPNTITFEESGKRYQLEATGVAARKKFFVKVYSIASYVEGGLQGLTGPDKFNDILKDGKAKQLTIKWVRDVPADKVYNGFLESFKSSLSPEQYSHLEKEINQYAQIINVTVKKGDVHEVRWLPDGYVEILINGKKIGSVQGKDFAVALWNIWFGPHSVVDRNNLITLNSDAVAK